MTVTVDPIQILDDLLTLIEEGDFAEAKSAARLARMAIPPGSKMPETGIKPGYWMRDDKHMLLVWFPDEDAVPDGWVTHYDEQGGDWYGDTVRGVPEYKVVTVEEVERRFGKIQ
jgi:hypothetical protein